MRLRDSAAIRDAIDDRCERWELNYALQWGAGQGHLDVVEAALKAGAEKNSRDRKGDTALSRAAAEGHVEIVEVLLRSSPDVDTAVSNSLVVVG